MPVRKFAIGEVTFTASSVHALFHCGFKKITDLWNHYNGMRDESFTEEAKKSMEFGTHFEEPVAQFFCKITGLKVRKCNDNAYYRKDMPYFICHPDRIGVGPDKKGRRFALEVKCVQPFAEGWGEEWTDQIPDYYYIQVQSYFACGVPCDVVYVACMRGNRVYIYEVLPDTEIIEEIRKRVRECKESFDKGIMPNSETCDVAIKRWASKIDMNADAVGADEGFLATYAELAETHKKLEECKAKEDELKAKVADFMGTAPAVVAIRDGNLVKIASWAQKTTSGWDMDRLAKDYPEIKVNDYKTAKISQYVKVNYKEAI